jgi:hypothetical protein
LLRLVSLLLLLGAAPLEVEPWWPPQRDAAASRVRQGVRNFGQFV